MQRQIPRQTNGQRPVTDPHANSVHNQKSTLLHIQQQKMGMALQINTDYTQK
jgi:hypothetical protein